MPKYKYILLHIFPDTTYIEVHSDHEITNLSYTSLTELLNHYGGIGWKVVTIAVQSKSSFIVLEQEV